MSKRIETVQQAKDFIVAGDRQMDFDWFWNSLDCDPRAIAELASSLVSTIGGERVTLEPGSVSYTLLCMEFGARLALRLDEADLALGKESA